MTLKIPLKQNMSFKHVVWVKWFDCQLQNCRICCKKYFLKNLRDKTYYKSVQTETEIENVPN